MMVSWDWSCHFCGTRDAECHRSDCKGFTPEAIKMRELYGQPYFGKRQFEPAETDCEPK